MKKVMLLMALIACVAWGYSQDGPQKEVLLVDYFTHSSDIGGSYPKMLRDAIIGGMQETGRMAIVDADAEAGLRIEADRRSSESAMGDQAARTEVMKTLGAKYVMTGHITEMGGVKTKSSDGSYYYDGVINFTLKITNVADGSVKVSKPFTYSGMNAKIGDTPEQAVLATADYVKISMKKFVNEHFKLESTIVAIETTDKKKGALTVYVNCGSAVGIQKSQLFDVKVEKEVAGKKILTAIGKLKAEEVQSEDMTLCKVTKGGEEIQKASDEGRKIVVISAGTGGLGGLTGAVGSFLK